MTNEGSNLRNLARSWSNNKSIKPGVYNCLMTIADRIDAEMVELPRDRDGKPIHVGETVYGDDGKAYVVCTLTLNSCDGSGQWLVGAEDTDIMFGPKLLTHERPDSWECISGDLDKLICERANTSPEFAYSSRGYSLAKIIDRICRLAEREDER